EGAAARTAAMSASTAAQLPARSSPRLMTMSTSAAPSRTARAASAALTSLWCAPDGNPHTVATTRPSAPCSGSCEGETQTASTPSSRASATRAATCSAVASGLSRVWSISWATSWRAVMAPPGAGCPPSLAGLELLPVDVGVVEHGDLDGLFELVRLARLAVGVDDLRRVVVLAGGGGQRSHGLLGVVGQVDAGCRVRRNAHRSPFLARSLSGEPLVWPAGRGDAHALVTCPGRAAGSPRRASTRRVPGGARCARAGRRCGPRT